MAVINNLLAEKSEIPLIIIASVSLGGLALLIANIALLHCYIQKRKGVKDSYSVGSAGSAKSATIEMYVGSSSQGGEAGDTLSSLSEKSDSYFAQEQDDYPDSMGSPRQFPGYRLGPGPPPGFGTLPHCLPGPGPRPGPALPRHHSVSDLVCDSKDNDSLVWL